jgi:predicted alpha/beta-fold hydrolase
LFLVSLDDPFLGVLPDQEIAANPHTVLAATQHGGHCAFLLVRGGHFSYILFAGNTGEMKG